MTTLKRFTPLIAIAALTFAAGFASTATYSRATSAPPDPVITAVDQPSLDAVSNPSALPQVPELAEADAQVAIPHVLAIEPVPAATNYTISAFALFTPAAPRPVLARALEPAEINPNDEGVPIAVKAWRGQRGRLRLTC